MSDHDTAIRFAEWINDNIIQFGHDGEGYFWVYGEETMPITTLELFNKFMEQHESTTDD